MATNVNSSNFMYAGGTTPGGYQAGTARTENQTGLWRSKVPFLPQAVPASDFTKAQKKAKYTYRNYAVPDFEGTELVGVPSQSYPMINGEQGYEEIRSLGNTTAELQRVQSWSKKELQTMQVAAVKAGWLPKGAATGMPNDKTVNLVAFLMDQGNQTGYKWQDVLLEGPEWLRKVGGADVVNGGADGAGKEYDGPVTSVQTSVNYSTKASARALLTATLSSVLGRGPKQEEIDDFLELLRSKEKANPTVTTTVRDGNDEGSLGTQDMETKGGYGADEAAGLAERFAKRIDPQQASRYKRAGYEQLLDSLIMGG